MVVAVVVCFGIIPSRQFGEGNMKSLVLVSVSHEALRPRVKQYRC